MDNVRRGNKQLIKELNRLLVVNAILNYEPVSRTKVAKLTELSLSTVSNIVASLIKRETKSRGGIGDRNEDWVRRHRCSAG